jgi:hypothetical protein
MAQSRSVFAPSGSANHVSASSASSASVISSDRPASAITPQSTCHRVDPLEYDRHVKRMTMAASIVMNRSDDGSIVPNSDGRRRPGRPRSRGTSRRRAG